ncbi:MAG: hypothetical protein ABIF77_10900 [bacterium]
MKLSTTHRQKPIWRETFSGLLALALMFLVPSVSALAELPTGEDVLAKMIEAAGGREAMEKLHNRVEKGTLDLPAMGYSATMTNYAAAPNLTYALIESEALGTIENGCNGEICWENMVMTGPRILSGEEAAMASRDATFHDALHWDELYTKSEVVGEETVAERNCYQLIMTPVTGKPESWFVDSETYLVAKLDMTIDSEMGTVSVVSYPSDYREVDGIKIAFSTRQVLMGMQEMVFTFETVEHNVELPAGIFDLPDEIKALMTE